MFHLIETTPDGTKVRLGTPWASSYPANKDADRAKLQGRTVDVLNFPSTTQADMYVAEHNANRSAA